MSFDLPLGAWPKVRIYCPPAQPLRGIRTIFRPLFGFWIQGGAGLFEEAVFPKPAHHEDSQGPESLAEGAQ